MNGGQVRGNVDSLPPNVRHASEDNSPWYHHILYRGIFMSNVSSSVEMTKEKRVE